MPASPEPPVRLAVRVRAGASRTRVGGRYGEGPDAPLFVAVSASAVEGAATEAVLRAVAEALDLRPRQVSLVRGVSSREKLLEISDPPVDLAERIARVAAAPTF